MAKEATTLDCGPMVLCSAPGGAPDPPESRLLATARPAHKALGAMGWGSSRRGPKGPCRW